jgi:hypothetical protein
MYYEDLIDSLEFAVVSFIRPQITRQNTGLVNTNAEELKACCEHSVRIVNRYHKFSVIISGHTDLTHNCV